VRILIVAATAQEVAPILEGVNPTHSADACVKTYTHGRHEIHVLITGVGMVATAVWCARLLTRTTYDLALNVGVCGSFEPAIQPGTVVHVVSDRLAELGAEDGETFLTLEELRLPGESAFTNAAPPSNPVLEQLPAVTGITVNTVHGNERTIARIIERFNPQVESMEGAAFMSACLINKIPFAQVRAVSNLVERRNRESWRMGDAIQNLGAAALRIVGAA
jgi:futalosine hydrolase